MRLFVGIFPPPMVVGSMLRATRPLLGDANLRWVAPVNVHLTLKFLGETPEEKFTSVSRALSETANRHTPFGVVPARPGAFPSTKRASVVWFGFGEGSEALRLLAADVEASLDPLGFARDARPYTPHATLARARGRPVRLVGGKTPEVPGFVAERVELVESRPSQGGAVYVSRAAYPLAPQGATERRGDQPT